MNTEFHIQKLYPSDRNAILKIADWYNKEWNTPIKKTIDRLSGFYDSGLYFQLIAKVNEEVIATVGLSDSVNLLNVYPEYEIYGPWVALLYTDKAFRNQGVGKALLEQIESEALTHNLNKIYLYTFTAETLYKRSGWQLVETVSYKNHDTVIMKKEIK
ncbi:MAG: GNAT family N-acetyltransferase [Flavobacteriales bacterium]|nr:GNAT family N-acetyltransferase [Flavobacteriales bacterium]